MLNRRLLALMWTVLATALAGGALFLAFRDLEVDRLLGVLRRGEGVWIAVLVVAVPLEQVVRGWQWRQRGRVGSWLSRWSVMPRCGR